MMFKFVLSWIQLTSSSGRSAQVREDPAVARRWRLKKVLALLGRASFFLSLHKRIGGAQARWRCSEPWLSSRKDDTAAARPGNGARAAQVARFARCARVDYAARRGFRPSFTRPRAKLRRRACVGREGGRIWPLR